MSETIKDQHGNAVAVEGCTRCACGCKYWENDRCVDCGATPPTIAVCSSCGRQEYNPEDAGDQRWLCEECLQAFRLVHMK